MPKYFIDIAGIYENDSLMLGTYSPRAHRNAQAVLRRRGFKLSVCKEAYYHPDHWDTSVMSFSDDPMHPDVGDTWIINDCFKAKSDLARQWLKRQEEGE